MNRLRAGITGILLLGSGMLAAQVTPKSKAIDITSTFKPVLREASKINLNASPPATDSTRPALSYTIPVQNLFFTYQPAALKPVALQMDSLTAWKYSNYIKVGAGNVHLPSLGRSRLHNSVYLQSLAGCLPAVFCLAAVGRGRLEVRDDGAFGPIIAMAGLNQLLQRACDGAHFFHAQLKVFQMLGCQTAHIARGAAPIAPEREQGANLFQ